MPLDRHPTFHGNRDPLPLARGLRPQGPGWWRRNEASLQHKPPTPGATCSRTGEAAVAPRCRVKTRLDHCSTSRHRTAHLFAPETTLCLQGDQRRLRVFAIASLQRSLDVLQFLAYPRRPPWPANLTVPVIDLSAGGTTEMCRRRAGPRVSQFAAGTGCHRASGSLAKSRM